MVWNWIAIGILALVAMHQWIQVYGLKAKLKDSIFIKREGDKLFFLDGQGKKISEKIIIKEPK